MVTSILQPLYPRGGYLSTRSLKGRVDLTDGLDSLHKRDVCCSCQKSKDGSSVVQLVSQSLCQLSCPNYVTIKCFFPAVLSICQYKPFEYRAVGVVRSVVRTCLGFQLAFSSRNKTKKVCCESEIALSPSEPSGHYMYHQFNSQQLYVLPTQCICVDLENKQRLFPYTSLTDWFL